MIDSILSWFGANQMALWLLIGVFCLLFEMISPGLFFFLSFFFGALFGALSSFVTVNWLAQAIVFLVGSFAAFLWLHYWVKRRVFSVRRHNRTNVQALQGQQGLVLREITPNNMGLVKVGGETWSARPTDACVITEGKKIVVVDNRGAHLVVKEIVEQEK
jgi:membrane protein implicated in regulation of membrane protease activity